MKRDYKGSGEWTAAPWYANSDGYIGPSIDNVLGDTTFYNMIFEEQWTPKVNEDWEEKLTGLNVHVYSDYKVKLETAN